MMVKDHVSVRFEYRALNIIMAPCRVILHNLPLSFRQRMPFIENPVLDIKLADVMEHACHECLSSGETEVFIAANNNIPGKLGGQD